MLTVVDSPDNRHSEFGQSVTPELLCYRYFFSMLTTTYRILQSTFDQNRREFHPNSLYPTSEWD